MGLLKAVMLVMLGVFLAFLAVAVLALSLGLVPGMSSMDQTSSDGMNQSLSDFIGSKNVNFTDTSELTSLNNSTLKVNNTSFESITSSHAQKINSLSNYSIYTYTTFQKSSKTLPSVPPVKEEKTVDLEKDIMLTERREIGLYKQLYYENGTIYTNETSSNSLSQLTGGSKNVTRYNSNIYRPSRSEYSYINTIKLFSNNMNFSLAGVKNKSLVFESQEVKNKKKLFGSRQVRFKDARSQLIVSQDGLVKRLVFQANVSKSSTRDYVKVVSEVQFEDINETTVARPDWVNQIFINKDS